LDASHFIPCTNRQTGTAFVKPVFVSREPIDPGLQHGIVLQTCGCNMMGVRAFEAGPQLVREKAREAEMRADEDLESEEGTEGDDSGETYSDTPEREA